MLHAAKHGRGYRRGKGPLSVDWWLASFVPFLAAALSEPSQPRVPGTLGARRNRIHIGNFPVLRDSRKAERTQAQRTAQTAPRAAPPTPPSVVAFCTILPILRPQPTLPSPVPSTTSARCPPSPSPGPIPLLGLPGIIVVSLSTALIANSIGRRVSDPLRCSYLLLQTRTPPTVASATRSVCQYLETRLGLSSG